LQGTGICRSGKAGIFFNLGARVWLKMSQMKIAELTEDDL
jgi:hypothetical protein